MQSLSTSKNHWKTFRRVFFWVRMAALVALAAASVQLALWNRAYDSRFYHFLSTPPGKALSRLMKWPNFYNQRAYDKPESDFTDEELLWKRRLEKRLNDSWPKHRVVLENGAELLGVILSETENHLSFRESFGGQGSLEQEIPRRTVRSVGPWRNAIPKVTWRDVRFQMEYPEFQLTWFGHYTVLTDAPYFQVASSVQELETLHRQYMDLFGSLVRFPKPGQRLQVLFFSREEQYRAHQETYAPSLGTSAGYYSPLEDRMVIFNQAHSQRSQQVRQEVNGEIENLFARAKNPSERRNILRMRDSVEEQLRGQGERETVATLRHEAAHHLSYTYGVHSWIHTENGWLIEGLAVYFETLVPGDVPPLHLASLLRMQQEGRLPRLAQLLNIRQPEQFEESLPNIAAYEAYALSWSLFHFCMEPRNRPGFFNYLRLLHSTENLGNWSSIPAEVHLARELGMNTAELESAWLSHLRTL